MLTSLIKVLRYYDKPLSDWYRKWYNVELNPDTEILPLIGSKEGIMHICMTYLDKGDEVLVPNPGYPTYRSAVKLAGGKCVEYKLREKNNYEPDFDKLEKSKLKKVKLMFVNYPQMPTGQVATASNCLKNWWHLEKSITYLSFMIIPIVLF